MANPFSLVMRRVIAEQYAKLPVPTTSLAGQTHIVTGSNNGLGLEAARHLVRCSASRVILAVRNTKAGEAAKVDIERTTGRKGVIEVWHVDLASFDSVKKFASRAGRELERIDGLIENAGVLLDSWAEVEGMETQMTVNVVSTILLGVLMMPKLVESARKFGNSPRLVFLVSALGFTSQAEKELAKGGKTDIFRGLNNPKQQVMDQRYSLTKLVEMYAVRALADAYPFEKTGVIINMVAPGICTTGLAKDARIFVRAAQGMIRLLFARSAEVGSRTLLHAVTEGQLSHGKHLSGCKIKDHWIAPWMVDAEGRRTQQQIWDELVALMEGVQTGCTSHVF